MGVDVVAFASGALVLACEVLFTHLLVLVVGTSAYAFGLIVLISLVCLFFGAALAPLFDRILRNHALALGLSAASLVLVATLPVWDSLPTLIFAEWARGRRRSSARIRSGDGRFYRAGCAYDADGFVVPAFASACCGSIGRGAIRRTSDGHQYGGLGGGFARCGIFGFCQRLVRSGRCWLWRLFLGSSPFSLHSRPP